MNYYHLLIRLYSKSFHRYIYLSKFRDMILNGAENGKHKGMIFLEAGTKKWRVPKVTFFSCHLTVPWPALGHSQGDSLANFNLMLITAFVQSIKWDLCFCYISIYLYLSIYKYIYIYTYLLYILYIHMYYIIFFIYIYICTYILHTHIYTHIIQQALLHTTHTYLAYRQHKYLLST